MTWPLKIRYAIDGTEHRPLHYPHRNDKPPYNAGPTAYRRLSAATVYEGVVH